MRMLPPGGLDHYFVKKNEKPMDIHQSIQLNLMIGVVLFFLETLGAVYFFSIGSHYVYVMMFGMILTLIYLLVTLNLKSHVIKVEAEKKAKEDNKPKPPPAILSRYRVHR